MRYAPLLEFEPQFRPESTHELTMSNLSESPSCFISLKTSIALLKSFIKNIMMCRSNKSVRFRGSTSLYDLDNFGWQMFPRT